MNRAHADDLVDRLENTVRDHVLGLMPDDASGELAAMPLRALLSVYWTWRERFPAARPRAVHRPRELAASPGAKEHAADLAELERKMTAGEDLTPHLSERVEVAYIADADRPSADRRMRDADRDRMLNRRRGHQNGICGLYHCIRGNKFPVFSSDPKLREMCPFFADLAIDVCEANSDGAFGWRRGGIDRTMVDNVLVIHPGERKQR